MSERAASVRTWGERLQALYELVGQVHTFAEGPGLARIHRPGQWSLGELVFGAEHRLWYVRSEAESPSLGALLREHYLGRTEQIEAVAKSTSASGMRLGRALVDSGVFAESEIVRVLRVQAAHGLLDIVGRMKDGDIDVVWTPLHDGAARLPAPHLDDAYLAAAHRVVVSTPVGPRLEALCALRRYGLAGQVFVRTGAGEPFLPVRSFGVDQPLGNLFRLSYDVTEAAGEADGVRAVVLPGREEPRLLIVDGERAALASSIRGQAARELVAMVERVLAEES